jgi:hypothetical protein
MKVVAIVLSLLAFIVCLVIGVQAGSQLQRQKALQAAQPATLINKDAQRTLLLIQVDDLSGDDPRLDGLSLLMYIPGHPMLTFIPLFPAEIARDGEMANRLAEAFSLDHNKALSQAFTNALKEEQIGWTGYILSDRLGLAALEAFLKDPSGFNGISDTIKKTNEADFNKDPASTIPVYCSRVNDLQASLDWTRLLSALIPDHLHTDLGLEMLLSDWKNLSSPGLPFNCKVITP